MDLDWTAAARMHEARDVDAIASFSNHRLCLSGLDLIFIGFYCYNVFISVNYIYSSLNSRL
jgi:hypothetical protein